MAPKNMEVDITLDMTPMIDCVFQLIIFFMLITDLSQKDLEELKLPTAAVAEEDKPDPKANRPVINLLADGTVWSKGEQIYDPEKGDYKELKDQLVKFASRMKRKPINPDKPASANNPPVPDEALLVRADENTPFSHVQKVMELCGQTGIQIWKLELAAAQVDKSKAGANGAAPQ